MSTATTGGPAFPISVKHDDGSGEFWYGATLRDYFAAKALPAEIARWPDGHPSGFDGIAVAAYLAADAMLKARKA